MKIKVKMQAIVMVIIGVFLTNGLFNAKAAVAEELIVSVPYAHYFDDPIEASELTEFRRLHPECTIKLIVQNTTKMSKYADVYIVDSEAQRIANMLKMERFASLDELISDDTRENVFILDHLTDNKGDLIALPLIMNVQMLTTMAGFDARLKKAEYPQPTEDVFLSWESILQWAMNYPYAGDDEKSIDVNNDSIEDDGVDISCYLISGITVIASQVNLMATDDKTSAVDFDTDEIKGFLKQLRDMFQLGIVGIHEEPINVKDIMFPNDALFDAGRLRLLSWTETPNEIPTFLPLPNIENNNSAPLFVVAGFVDDSSPRKELAVAFLESLISLEAQMQVPTSGTVRKDLYEAIITEVNNNSEWAREMVRLWRDPISSDVYENYLYTIEHSRIGLGSLLDMLKSAQIIVDYCNDRISLEEALVKLDDVLTSTL